MHEAQILPECETNHKPVDLRLDLAHGDTGFDKAWCYVACLRSRCLHVRFRQIIHNYGNARRNCALDTLMTIFAHHVEFLENLQEVRYVETKVLCVTQGVSHKVLCVRNDEAARCLRPSALKPQTGAAENEPKRRPPTRPPLARRRTGAIEHALKTLRNLSSAEEPLLLQLCDKRQRFRLDKAARGCTQTKRLSVLSTNRRRHMYTYASTGCKQSAAAGTGAPESFLSAVEVMACFTSSCR
eukprot:SAG11_NODE_2552_length_3229_cov_1.244728_3_plen_241_part_00